MKFTLLGILWLIGSAQAVCQQPCNLQLENTSVPCSDDIDENDGCFALSESVERVLKVHTDSDKCNKTCELEFNNAEPDYFIKLHISKNKTLYLRIPPELKTLQYRIQDSSSMNINPTNLKLTELNALPGHLPCIHEFPESWNTSIEIKAERKSIRAQISPPKLCFAEIKYFIVKIFEAGPGVLYCKGNNIVFMNYQKKSSPDLKLTFENLTNGNYCIRVYPQSDLCADSSCEPRYSETISIEDDAVPPVQYIKSKDTDEMKYLAIGISVFAALVVLAVLGFLYRYCRSRKPTGINEDETKQFSSLEKELKHFQRKPRPTILLLRCNEDERINRDVEHFISFLEQCCYCKVLHAKTSDAQTTILEQSVPDWCSFALQSATKTIVLVTDRAHDICHRQKFRESFDPNECLFCDKTFLVGVQLLKENDDIKRVFARFCYTNDRPLNELTDAIVEVPQALVYLFHNIHSQSALIGTEEEFIDYWMSKESFRYLHNLRRDKQVEDSPETPLLGLHLNNINRHQMTEHSVNCNGVVTLNEFNNSEQKQCTKQCNIKKDLYNGNCDSGFHEEISEQFSRGDASININQTRV